PACNEGARWALEGAVLFLNNDVRLVSPDPFEAIRAQVRSGVAVGAQLRTDPHGDVDGRPCAYLGGWCLAMMLEDFWRVGAWDEGFEEPSYYGDNDLCLRLRMGGVRLVVVPVGVQHLENRTSRLMHPLDRKAVTER